MDSRNNNISLMASDTTELAYIGDAVYEVYIRRYVLENQRGRINSINRAVIDFVRADGQAGAARILMNGDFLTEEEIALMRRARNHTNTNHPRGASPMAYKMATALEALIGYLYLAGETARLEEVVAEIIRLIGGTHE